MMDGQHQKIAAEAYRLWEQEGCPGDRSLEHWLAAERRIAGETDAGSPTAPTGKRKSSAKAKTPRKNTPDKAKRS